MRSRVQSYVYGDFEETQRRDVAVLSSAMWGQAAGSEGGAGSSDDGGRRRGGAERDIRSDTARSLSTYYLHNWSTFLLVLCLIAWRRHGLAFYTFPVSDHITLRRTLSLAGEILHKLVPHFARY